MAIYRDERKRKPIVLCTVLILAITFAVVCIYAGYKKDRAIEQGGTADPPGMLVGVSYNRTSGSVARRDFFIQLSPEKVVYSTYWPADEDYYANGEQYTPAVKENVAITKEQWADVEQIVLELYPQLEEIPEKRDHYNIPLPGVHVLDGGDESNLTLLWDTGEAEKKIDYNLPNDRRTMTLLALLEELVDPVGREIPRYGPPVLSGIYVGQSGCFWPERNYSFNLNRDLLSGDVEHSAYTLYASFYSLEESQKVHATLTVPEKEWDAFASFAAELGLEACPDVESDKQPYCALYYSDGRQQRKKLGRATAEQLRQYLTNLALRLAMQNAQP